MDTSIQTLRSVIWRNLQMPGHEYCALVKTSSGFGFSGQAILVDDRPYCIQYEIQCDSSWNTESVWVKADTGSQRVEKRFQITPEGDWSSEAEDLSELHGCLDIDLGFSPATNTLPIRRLRLKDQESCRMTAAWIRFPGFMIRPLEQVYTNLGGGIYRYHSVSSGFTAEIAVDDLGLVTSYPKGWIRESAI